MTRASQGPPAQDYTARNKFALLLCAHITVFHFSSFRLGKVPFSGTLILKCEIQYSLLVHLRLTRKS